MCILVFKPKGINFPTKAILENCFLMNPDGSGYAWVDRSGISHIRKGFLTFHDFYESISQNMEKLTKFDVLLHFRFATHGSVSPGNCHPFPVSCRIDDLKSTVIDGKFKIMAHNGIISSLGHRAKKTRSDLSDTMVFSKELRSFGENNRQNKRILESGKFVIMDRKGSRRYGNFIKEDGIFYSNDGYLGYDYIWPKWDYIWPKWDYKPKKSNDFKVFEIEPCRFDINKNGNCIHSRYCIDQGYCEISGCDLPDIVGIESYEKICPLLKDIQYRNDILMDVCSIEEIDRSMCNVDKYLYY